MVDGCLPGHGHTLLLLLFFFGTNSPPGRTGMVLTISTSLLSAIASWKHFLRSIMTFFFTVITRETAGVRSMAQELQ